MSQNPNNFDKNLTVSEKTNNSTQDFVKIPAKRFKWYNAQGHIDNIVIILSLRTDLRSHLTHISWETYKKITLSRHSVRTLDFLMKEGPNNNCHVYIAKLAAPADTALLFHSPPHPLISSTATSYRASPCALYPTDVPSALPPLVPPPLLLTARLSFCRTQGSSQPVCSKNKTLNMSSLERDQLGQRGIGDALCAGLLRGLDHIRDPQLNKVGFHRVSLSRNKRIPSDNAKEIVARLWHLTRIFSVVENCWTNAESKVNSKLFLRVFLLITRSSIIDFVYGMSGD